MCWLSALTVRNTFPTTLFLCREAGLEYVGLKWGFKMDFEEERTKCKIDAEYVRFNIGYNV
jgi:hypothetical protein